MNIWNPGNGVTKMKSGDLTVDISQIIRNFTGAETDENKKSVLQKLLEPKEVDDSEKEARKALQIAKKIARGESVSPEEKQLLMRVNPQLAQMAELARKEGERIKHALQQASSKEEQQAIVGQAYQQVTEVSKANPQFGMLLGEAVKAAIQEAKEEPKAVGALEEGKEKEKEPMLEGSSVSNVLFVEDGEQKRPSKEMEDAQKHKEAEARQEEMFEQFYPEEWASMLDCKG